MTDSDQSKRLAGVFSDGQTAAGCKVELSLTSEGIDVLAGDERLVYWSYNQIQSTEPLVPGRPANISNKATPDARLYIADDAFSEALLVRAPQLSAKAENKRVLVPIYLMLVGLIVAATLFWMSSWSPSRMIAGWVPDNMRRNLGEQVIGFIGGGRKVCEAPAGRKALDKLVARLNSGLPQDEGFKVQVIDLAMNNAFAAPGEQIVVSQKLIRFTNSPEELAGVVAHEMGHGLERHPETGLVRSVGISALINLISGGSAGNMGKIGGFLLKMSYTRDAEREADDHAIKLLRKAALPAKPLASFFDKIQEKKDKMLKKRDGLDSALSLLSTHPPLPERVETISRHGGYATRPLLNKQEWRALRNICGPKKSKKRDSPKNSEKSEQPDE